MILDTTEKSQLLYFLHIAGLRLTQQAQQATTTRSVVNKDLELLNSLYKAVSAVDTNNISNDQQQQLF
jgi:mannose/fructose/N-acetylgalactosamine-specific phosphotransferase system component IIB